MKYLNYIITTGIILSIFSCGGKNSKEAEVNIDSTKSVVINFQPEYYFSGEVNHTSDTTLFVDLASGATWGVMPNKTLEELIQAIDSIVGQKNRIITQVRGYLYNTGKEKDTHKMLYMTHIEGIKTTETDDLPAKIAGTYERSTDRIILNKDHTCTINLGNSGKNGEWYMSNDTLIYITAEGNSYLFDAAKNGEEIRMHKDHNFVLIRK